MSSSQKINDHFFFSRYLENLGPLFAEYVLTRKNLCTLFSTWLPLTPQFFSQSYLCSLFSTGLPLTSQFFSQSYLCSLFSTGLPLAPQFFSQPYLCSLFPTGLPLTPQFFIQSYLWKPVSEWNLNLFWWSWRYSPCFNSLHFHFLGMAPTSKSHHTHLLWFDETRVRTMK